MGIGAGVLLLLVIAFFAYPPLLHRGRPSGAPGQDSSSLSLRVERTAGEILLTWNRDSDTIRTATHAVLNITDGDQHENVEMDLAQLRNGSISYSPASGDVVFKMEVTGKNDEKTASESVRALRTRPSPLAGAEQPPQPVATPQQQPAAKPVTPVNGAPVNGSPAAAGTPVNNNLPPVSAPPPQATEEAPAKTPERALRPFQAPTLSQRLHPANPSDLPDAPTLGNVQTSSVSSVPGLNMGSVAAPVAPKAPTPAATQSAPPPAAAPTKAAPSGGQIQQAVLISKKDPEYPKMARETGAKGIVELLATIGTDGRVKSVKVVKGPQMLQKAASDAVLQWKYKPTILNGVPVEAQTQVYVNFTGGR
jgi:protein TonB